MKHATKRLVAVAIVAAELASLGLAATSASAQDAQQVRRQQRLILQQQRRIEQNQRRLDAQEQQLARPAAGAPRDVNRGIFGNIGNCPVGWSYDVFTGCLPAVHVIR